MLIIALLSVLVGAVSAFVAASLENAQLLGNVTFDRRAIAINGDRVLLHVGHIHYPRSTPEMWPRLFKKTRDAGINAIDTYVFWSEHEPERGVFDFEGRKNLRLFLQLAREHDLYVILRIGPYVCAEYNYGGFPAWLREVPGIDFRTMNEPFKREMQRFVEFTVDYTKDLFFQNGGPVIILQVENEYGLVQHHYGKEGREYIQWAADMANGLNAGLPWIMCVQDNVPSVINTCNGFYCDNWVAHDRKYWDQPGMWTENWSGWFSYWGDVKPTRPTADLAFAVARWFARGGTYNAYYMWHGGTNFGRMAGYKILTSYDYDAPLDEYGFEAEPKYSHLKRLHEILNEFSSVILAAPAHFFHIKSHVEMHIFGDAKASSSLIMISNIDAENDADISHTIKLVVPRWSVTILQGPLSNPTVLYNTAKIGAPVNDLVVSPVFEERQRWVMSRAAEPIGVWNQDAARFSTVPNEQVFITRDKSDYLWYVSRELELPSGLNEIMFEEVEDHVMLFWNDELVGISRGGKNIAFKIREATKRKGHLKAVTSTLGLTNFGPHVQEYKRGIIGRVLLNGNDITEIGWTHQTGLLGEKNEFHLPTSDAFKSRVNSDLAVGFSWYRVQFPAVEVDVNFAYAIDLKGLGKGNVWVNGEHLGRYWNITTSLPTSPTDPYPKPDSVTAQSTVVDESTKCDYAGSFNADKCRDGPIGAPTQRYYHIPRDWLKTDTPNVAVLFEEEGGSLGDIRLVKIERKNVEQADVLVFQ